MPSVVSAGRLQEANALLRLASSATSIVGAGLAGLVVAGIGAGWALAFDAVTFLVSAAFVFQVVAGGGVEVFSVMWDTAMQQQIPHHRLSRVYSYDALGSFVCIPIGLSIAGPLSGLLGVGGALVFAGCVVVVATCLVLTVHDVRALRRTAPGEPVPIHEPELIPEPSR
ncbi:MAG TPA: hypothetical protein VFU10_02790 [Gaiellaceae bacterium]|nr:hypothetical protein [Gaiellaceae bacterium]